MIRAVLKKGRIQPLDKLPPQWREGQELLIDAAAPSDNPAEIEKWYEEWQVLSAQVPPEDHKRMAEALALLDREAKDSVRREMGLS